MSRWNVTQADVIEWAARYKGDLFHALLCDAPYELNFMNKKWDATGISYRKETWEAYYNILLPGAFGMSFGGSRTAHRIAVAIEDAGFIIHPMIGWIQGQGFPKASRIDTKIDARAGAEREIIGQESDGRGRSNIKNMEAGYRPNPYSEGDKFDVTAPATDLAKEWAGHRYGLQALKPAMEPIIVFQKPYEGKPLDSMVKYGAGALNIEGSRIGTETIPSNQWTDDAHPFGGGAGNEYKTVENKGRWPANVVLSHSPDCTPDTCAEGCGIKAMGDQSGILTSGEPMGVKKAENNIYGEYGKGLPVTGFGDSGTAARFFLQADWNLENSDPFFYCPKVSQVERDAGINDDGEKVINSLRNYVCKNCGKSRLDGRRNGSCCDNPEYELSQVRPTRNNHPSLKPIALCQHLASLLLPPEMYAPRRIVVPFCGTGSEMIGCLRAGWEIVEGIELDAHYVELAGARLTHYAKIPIQRRLL